MFELIRRMMRRPTPQTDIPLNRRAYVYTDCGKPRGCLRCAGRLVYKNDGKDSLLCERCHATVPDNQCGICGGDLHDIKGMDHEVICIDCEKVRDRWGKYITAEACQDRLSAGKVMVVGARMEVY